MAFHLQAAPPLISNNSQLCVAPSNSSTSIQSSATTTHQVTTTISSPSGSAVMVDKAVSEPSRSVSKPVRLPKEISQIVQIRDDLYRIEESQMTLIDKLEVKHIFVIPRIIILNFQSNLLLSGNSV